MRVHTILIAFIILKGNHVIAQNTNPWPATGNVGIGTTTPSSLLHVYNANAPENTIGSVAEYARFSGLINTNLLQFRFLSKRHTLNGDWTSVSSRLQFTTDVSDQGYLEFNPSGGAWGMALGIGNTEAMRLNANGNIGIGTTNPQEKLDIAGTGKMNFLAIDNGSADGGRAIFRSQGYNEWRARNFQGSLGFFPGEGNATALWLQSDGNVGIGTVCAHAKLAVDGNILAKKVTVSISSSNWCDYVFNNDYKLSSLAELEQYIQQNHHLPEVPSAKEVEKNGLDLGDNQAALLKKIEELTLYVIEQNKKLADQQLQTEALRQHVKELEAKVNQTNNKDNH